MEVVEKTMANTMYRNFIRKAPYRKSIYPEITVPAMIYRGDSGGKDLQFDWSCITQPFVMHNRSDVSSIDRFLIFAGNNAFDYREFHAEIEFSLGEKGDKYTVKEPKLVYIPKGLKLGPINFKKVDKPVQLMYFYLSAKYSKIATESDYSKYLGTPHYMDMCMEFKNYMNGQLSREQTVKYPTMIALGKMAGGGNLSAFWHTMDTPHVMQEPVHFHDFDMWTVFFPANPTDVQDWDAKIEMFWGEDAAEQDIASPAIVHIPAGLLHRSVDYRRIKRPFYHINLFNAPEYFKEKEKIVSKAGEIQLPEGVKG
jgi:hypothetical protein